MRSKKKIIITGGMGTGKSTVLEIFKKRLPGYEFGDMDKIVDLVYTQPPKEFHDFMMEHFGTTNKKEISSIVFNNSDKLNTLNDFLYIYVENYLTEWFASDTKTILEFPLFFEMLQKADREQIDKNICHLILHGATIVVIRADNDVRINRILERSKATHPNWDRQTIENILNNQLDSKIKESMATEVIDNSDTIEKTERQIEILCESLKVEN